MDADLRQVTSGNFELTWHKSHRKDIFDYASGQLTDIGDRNGNNTHFDYNDKGCGWPQVDTITGTRGDSAGKIVHITYDTTAGGCARTGMYQTDSGSVSRSVDIGQVVGGVNYADPYSFIDANGGEYDLDFDGSHNLISVITPEGHETDIGYDASHRVTSITRDPSGINAVTSFAYPTAGRVNVTDPMGHVTTYYSDPFGQITSVVDANGHTQSSGWSKDHKVGSTTNTAGKTTNYSYGANPVNSGTGPLSTGESLTDAKGPASGTATGAESTAAYPAPTGSAGDYLPTSATSTNSKSQYFAYDGPGNQLSSANGSGGSADTAKAEYNGDGTLKTSTEPINVSGTNATTYQYDGDGNLTGVTPPTGNSLTGQNFTYDGFGRLATATSGRGITTTYYYDNLDHVTQTTYSSGASTVTMNFDGDGNMTSRTDGSGTTGYAYDALNRLLGKNLGSASVTCPSSPSNSQLCYSYDKAGNLTGLSDGRGTTAYTYDPVDNVTKMVEGASGNVDVFAYNKDNQRTDTWYKATGYTLNANNIVTAVPTGFAGHIYANINTTTNKLDGLTTSRASTDSTLVENLAMTYISGTKDTNVRQTMADNIAGTTTTYNYDTSSRLPPPSSPPAPAPPTTTATTPTATSPSTRTGATSCPPRRRTIPTTPPTSSPTPATARLRRRRQPHRQPVLYPGAHHTGLQRRRQHQQRHPERRPGRRLRVRRQRPIRTPVAIPARRHQLHQRPTGIQSQTDQRRQHLLRT